jgi:phosphotriesterase-related protein
MMAGLMTVNGLLDLSRVNLVCPHEHIFIDLTHEAVAPKDEKSRAVFESNVSMDKLGLLRRNPYCVKNNLMLDEDGVALEEVKLLKATGCDLLVDATSIGLGRDIERIKAVADNAGLSIVAGSGLFVHDAVPARYQDWSAEEISGLILDEIENGINGTGIKPGIIGEIGVSERIYPLERNSILGAGIAADKSGLPVYLHTYPWSHAGLDAVRLLLDTGVKPEKVCVCHLDVTFDDPYLHDILKTGVYIEFDNFGKEFYFPKQEGAFAGGPFETDIARVRMLKKLSEEGWTNRLLLANDVCLKVSLVHYGGWGYIHVFDNIRSMMIQEGIPENAVETMVVNNPKQFLNCER